MKKLPALAFVLQIIAFLSVLAFAQEQPRSLEANSPVSREISAGQRHGYTLRLNANQIARVNVEQLGVDVVVAVASPGGKMMFEVDSPTGARGNETVTIFASAPGAYRVEVRPLDEKSASGKYEIRLERFLTESEYQTERLAGLGRLWGAAKFFHPYLAYKNIDWDGALIKAIPQVRSARTPEQYRQAIDSMLQTLNDPLTASEPSKVEAGSGALKAENEVQPTYYRIVEGFVIVNGIDWAKAFMTGSEDAFAKLQPMMQEIGKSKGIILDCRYGGLSSTELPSFHLQRYLSFALPQMLQGLVPLGTQRYRIHSGYPPQQGNTSGGYSSSLVTDAPSAIDGRAAVKKPISVIIDRRAGDLIPVLAGLQAYGAKIVQAGAPDGASAASSHPIQLPDGLRVRLRTTEFIHPDGGSGFTVDTRLPEGTSVEKAISEAIAALTATTGERRPASSPGGQALVAQSLTDDSYPRMNFPADEYRLLALFRFWNVIAYFFPYKHLVDKPWDTVLTEFIPRFLENKTSLDYEMTVAEMVARIQDSHGFVRGFKSLQQHLGTHAPPIQLGAVSGKLVVIAKPDQAVAPGVNVGDVIVAIDGQTAEERIAYLSKFTALSTVQSGYSYIYPLALRGAPNTKARLKIESTEGKVHEIEVARSISWMNLAPGQRATPKVYEVLPSGYGYIDLQRLQLSEAHKALDSMMNTPAIIFDMRGYPNGTAWALAPRLTEKKNVTAALFRRPFQSAENLGEGFAGGVVPDFSFGQNLPPAAGAVYKGKVVMLINHEAISQAEHTCMFFEAATDVTFIGTATNGANGDVTNVSLPGGFYVSFSGHDVRHADGRQLQRLGIQPTVRVEPTVAGVREGRDEVLEAAIKFLTSGAKK